MRVGMWEPCEPTFLVASGGLRMTDDGDKVASAEASKAADPHLKKKWLVAPFGTGTATLVAPSGRGTLTMAFEAWGLLPLL